MSLFSFSRASFETRLARKLQERFINISRRNKLLARWAFKLTNLPKKMREEYVYDLVKSFIFIPSDARLIRNIIRDLKTRGLSIDRETVVTQLRRIERRLGIRNFDDGR